VTLPERDAPTAAARPAEAALALQARAGGSMRFSSLQSQFDFEKTGSRSNPNTRYK
jgi:hypothetical protein